MVDTFRFHQLLFPRFRHGAHQLFRLMKLLAEIVPIDGVLKINKEISVKLYDEGQSNLMAVHSRKSNRTVRA